MIDAAAEALARRILVVFPASTARTRADVKRIQVPVARLVGAALDRQADRLAALPESDWLDARARDLPAAAGAWRQALRDAAQVPAAAWEEAVAQASRLALSHLVRPAETAAADAFADGPARLPIDAALARVRVFGAYGYLPEIAARYAERKGVADLDRAGLERLLRRIDRRMVEDFGPDEWIAMAGPLYDLLGPISEPPDSVGTGLLRAFFEAKGRHELARTLVADAYTRDALHARLSDVLPRDAAPPSAQTAPATPDAPPAPAPSPADSRGVAGVAPTHVEDAVTTPPTPPAEPELPHAPELEAMADTTAVEAPETEPEAPADTEEASTSDASPEVASPAYPADSAAEAPDPTALSDEAAPAEDAAQPGERAPATLDDVPPSALTDALADGDARDTDPPAAPASRPAAPPNPVDAILAEAEATPDEPAAPDADALATELPAHHATETPPPQPEAVEAPTPERESVPPQPDAEAPGTPDAPTPDAPAPSGADADAAAEPLWKRMLRPVDALPADTLPVDTFPIDDGDDAPLAGEPGATPLPADEPLWRRFAAPDAETLDDEDGWAVEPTLAATPPSATPSPVPPGAMPPTTPSDPLPPPRTLADTFAAPQPTADWTESDGPDAGAADGGPGGTSADGVGADTASEPAGPASLDALEDAVLGPGELDRREWFVNALFGGSRDDYHATLDRLAEAPDWTAATQIIAGDVFRKHRVSIYSEASLAFTDAVETRLEARGGRRRG